MKTGTATSAEVGIRNTEMSNQNEFSWQDAMRSGQTLFSQMLEDAIMSLGHDDLLMPHMNDYRIDAMSGGEPVIEFDLHLSAGGLQRIVVPFTDDQAIMAASVAEIRARLADVLDNLHDLLQLRAEVEADVRARMVSLKREGFTGRVIDVRLSPIDLTASSNLCRVMVEIEGTACHMLRAFRDRWFIETVEDVAEQVVQFHRWQRDLIKLRDQAIALGAVGFVDPLALIALDRLPGGRQSALRSIAHTLQRQWFVSEEDSSPEMIGLTWDNGVVRGVANLGNGVELSVRDLIVRGAEFDETCIGHSIHDFSSSPILMALNEGTITECFKGLAFVKIDTVPLPFTSQGFVLALH